MGAARSGVAEQLGYLNKAAQYCRDVLSGSIPACKWVKLACQRQIDDLKQADEGTFPYYFDEAKASRVCTLIELLPHIEGPLAGKKIRLEPWQCFIITTVFGWMHRQDDPAKGIKAGMRRYRKAYVEVPRKNGKSTFSAGISLYMLGFDGEGGAQCYSVATSVEQAQAVYRPAKLMVPKVPELGAKFGISVLAHRLVQERTGSFFRALPFKGKGLDSLNPHLAIVDELHAHKTREVYEVIASGMGARSQPLLWTITTAGFDRSGICFEKHTYVQMILEGKAADESFFGVIYTIDDGDDPFDESSWIKANPNWNVSVSPLTFAQDAKEAQQLASMQNEFKVKRLCVWCNADSAWMDMGKWNACQDTSLDIEDFDADDAIVGLDLAYKDDLASVVKVYRRIDEDTGKSHFYAFCNNWLPEATIAKAQNAQYRGWEINGWLASVPGEVVDFDAIEEHIKDFSRTTNVLEVAYDPAYAHQMAQHLMEELGEDKLVSVKPTKVNFSPAMFFLEAIVFEGRFHFGGDPVLTWCMSNVVSHKDEMGNIYPRKQTAENKIDAIVALLMAINRWTAHEEGDGEPSISFF